MSYNFSNPYQDLVDKSKTYFQQIPDTVNGMSAGEIAAWMESLAQLPIGFRRTVNTLSEDYQYILPHRKHPHCKEECGFLMDRQLTMLLWEAYETALYIHVNGFGFDKSHKFIGEAMAALFYCKKSEESSPICAEHQAWSTAPFVFEFSSFQRLIQHSK